MAVRLWVGIAGCWRSFGVAGWGRLRSWLCALVMLPSPIGSSACHWMCLSLC